MTRPDVRPGSLSALALRLGCGRRAGYSLIEVLMGIAIFSTSFLMLLSIFPTSRRAGQLARDTAIATTVATDRLELAKTLDFEDITPANLPSGTVQARSVVHGVSQAISFTYQYAVHSTAEDLKTVAVLVTWPSSNGIRTLRMDTVLWDPGA